MTNADSGAYSPSGVLLTAGELQVLKRIVTLYIEYAERRPLGRKAITMQDWIAKLDEFQSIARRDLLDHAGQLRRRQRLDLSTSATAG